MSSPSSNVFFARIPDHLLQQVRDGTFRVFGGEIRDKQGKIQGDLEIVGREGLENAQAIINEFAGTAASALAGANYWRRLEERAGAALEGASEDEVFVLVRQELELAE